MIPNRLSIQLQKRLDAARAEVTRLESALAVFHELGGAAGPNGKTRSLDAAAAMLTSSTPAGQNGSGDVSTIPASLTRWRAAQVAELPHKHRKRAALAVVDALGAGATVDAAVIMLRELGYATAPYMISQSTRHGSIKRAHNERLTLTPRGRALLATVPAAELEP